MRLAIAQAFFQRPAVLLLDEPTNHLDIDGVLWLQSYLTDPSRLQTLSLVVVSHDRAFLQAVATDIIIFKDKKLTEFQGERPSLPCATKFTTFSQLLDPHYCRNHCGVLCGEGRIAKI